MRTVFNGWALMLLISGILAAFFLQGLPEFLQIRRLAEQRQFVPVEVVRITESHLGRQPSYYLHFIHHEQEHSIRINRDFSNTAKSAKTINLLHSSKYPDLFLAPNYDATGQLLDYLLLTGLFLLAMGISLVRLLKN